MRWIKEISWISKLLTFALTQHGQIALEYVQQPSLHYKFNFFSLQIRTYMKDIFVSIFLPTTVSLSFNNRKFGTMAPTTFFPLLTYRFCIINLLNCSLTLYLKLIRLNTTWFFICKYFKNVKFFSKDFSKIQYPQTSQYQLHFRLH